MAVSSLMVPLGTPAPDFALPTTQGGEFRLSRHLGKVVALTVSDPDLIVRARKLG